MQPSDASVRRAGLAAILGFLLVVPWFVGSYYHFLLSLALINIILATGLNLLTGNAGQISLCHSSFMAIGAYATTFLFATAGMTFWLALPLGSAVAGVFGVLLGLPALRLRGFYLAVVTLGFLEINLTVAENLEVAAYLPQARRDFRHNRERVESYFPVLGARRRQAAGLLSGGEQQMLAIGRALMSVPRLLVLDEPSLGLAPRTVRDIFRVIRRINAEGVTIVVAEQNANQVLAAADHVYVLESGRVAVSGTGAELRERADIRRTYLGLV
jgi:branched-chain amino acid transport system ATP-binding protein